MKPTVESIIPAYLDNLYQAAYAVLQNMADAQDAVQLTFIKYHEKDLDFESEEHMRRWLFRTVLNQAKDTRRSFWRKNRTELNESITAIFETPEDRQLFEEVSALPPSYRVVLQLYYYEDFSVKEIAQMIHLSQAAVKKRLSRGRQLLKNHLKGESEHEQD